MGKGQVAVYILLGLVILIAIAGVFVLRYTVIRGELDQVSDTTLEETKPVQTFVGECLKLTSQDAVYYVGSQGGFTYLPEFYLEADYSSIAYGYFDSGISLISLESLEEQVAEYIKINLFYCLNDFSSFENEEITYDYSEVEIDVKVNQNDVIVDVDFPILVEGTTLDSFSAEVPIALGSVHSYIYEIMEKTSEDPEWIDMSYLASLELLGYEAEVIPENENTLVYSIGIGEFVFLSAVYLETKEVPMFIIPESFELLEHELFSYQINYTNGEFIDDTFLFDITEEGLISFTPEIPGEFEVTIRLSDSEGFFTEKKVMFIVTEGGSEFSKEEVNE